MANQPSDVFIEIYGDGSHTTPCTWWASLGGSGLWIPDAELAKDLGEGISLMQNMSIPAIGQPGSSTRQELAGCLLALTLPVRSLYATDSASMKGKAEALLTAAGRMTEKEKRGLKVDWANPFKKPWGIQKDGDLWQQA